MRLGSLFFVVTFALSLLSPRLALAQQPQVDINTSTGAPGTIYHGTDIDDVNLGSGNLRIRLPLLQLPGRGLNTGVVLTYNSKIWETTTRVVQWSPDPTSWTTEHIAAVSQDTNSNPAAGWSVGFPRMGRQGKGWDYCLGQCGAPYHYTGWVSNDGTRTTLVSDAAGSSPSQHSFDGSYIRSATLATTVVYKDGVKASSTSLEDTNGNMISCANAGCTDTIGRVINFNRNSGGQLQSISYIDSSGTTRTISFAYQTFTLSFPWVIDEWGDCNTNPFGPDCGINISGPSPLLTQVTLPNGLSYQFQYFINTDGTTTGEISKLTLPTGGYIRYQYGFTLVLGGTPDSLGGQNRGVTSRIVSADGTAAAEKTWTYSIQNSNYFGCCPTLPVSTVTDPLGNIQANTHQLGVPSKIEYKNSSGTVLKTIVQTIGYDNSAFPDPSCLCANPRITARTTILNDTNQQSNVTFAFGTMGNVSQESEYDWGNPGPLLRTTAYSYWHDANPAYAATTVNILDRMASRTICNPAGTFCAQMNTTYDGATPAETANVVQHDYTGYPATYNLRGNPTQVSRNVNTTNTWLTTINTYNDVGDLLQTTDPKGYSTSFSYSDNFYNFTPTTPTLAFVTQTTFPGASHVQKHQYYFNSGLPAADCGQNFAGAACNFGLAAPQADYTTYTYDLMNRRLILARGDGGQNSVFYNEASTPITITSTTKINATTNYISQSVYDGLGRLTQTQLNSDPDCPSGDKTDTTYDALGRVYTVSNPYCIAGESTSGLITYTYDALGRTTQLMHPDNTTVLTTYTGRAIQVQDEGNGGSRVTRISQTDGLGRLKSVCEVSGASLIGSGGTAAACGQDFAATGFLTSYEYNALDNLTQVNQSGITARTFNYDSLSRLLSATNPESGQICYGTVSMGACQVNGYDANSNLVTKTDARGIITTHSYDELNRLTGKTYSDSTPAATFNYDQTSALGVTLTNTKGRKSSQSTAGTGSIFSYDTMGRISDNSQCTPQNCGTGVFALQYTQYDFLGDLTSATNAAGVTFTYAYNTAGRLTGITTNFIDPSHPGTLLSNAQYSPFGALTSATLGNSVTESWGYNNRLWQKSRTATFGATTPYSFTATFAPNGDILSANDSANGNWVYKYDDFNRLTCSNLASNGTCATPTTGTPTYTYDYDRFGNRWHQNGPQSFVATFTGNNPANPQNNNRMDGYSYDVAGNLLNDGVHSYAYDAENRIVSIDGGATAAYVYDVEGRRVRKTTSGSSMDYLYDLSGHKVADVDPTGIFMRGELYAGERHFAIFAPDPGPTGATFFTHSDWLGTERVRTDMTGTNCESIASLPFGDGQSMTGTCGDVSPMHFTGKERDSESGLDNFGARYFSSSMGRWFSPDILNLTSARLVNPSNTLNKYAYAADNPLTYIDRDGQDITIFYRPPSGTFNMDFGHLFIGAVNQNTQQVGFLDFYPKGSVDSSGKGPGAFNLGNMQDRAAQVNAGKFATLTIQTTPEAAQKVLDLITALQKGDAPGYAALSKNCTTLCEDVLRDLGLDFGDILPESYFLDSVRKYSPTALIPYNFHVPVSIRGGQEYGNPRNVGMDYTRWLFELYLNQFQNRQATPPKNPDPPKPAAKCPLCPP